jgi:hypothetical protein
MSHGRVGFVAGLVVLALFGGLVTAATAAPRKDLLHPDGTSYPRVIRLEHNGPANGRILASVGTVDGSALGIIMESIDGGVTFQQVGTIADPEGADGRGMCCGTLFELPSPVGDMPAGTLLWAATVGYKVPDADRHTTQRLWVSHDLGRTWSFRSDIATSPNQYNGWEPDLSVAADGQLVANFSDESDKANHDQKLVRVRSADGLVWTDYQETVKNDDFFVRPGMAGVRRLADGTYLMVYEVCNLPDEPMCDIHFRTSPDGWDYGDPNDLGTVVRTEDGKYVRHTPTITVSPSGAIVLVAEMLVNSDGSKAAANGRTLLVNENNGAGPWREIPAPVEVPSPDNHGCMNFSPSLLASPDGASVLEVATDLVDGVCHAFYATGPIPPVTPPGRG